MSDKPFYTHIAGLRGLAIILVFLFHLYPSVLPYGYFGVDVFFVISGYLLSLSFLKNDGRIDLKHFVTRKLERIYVPMLVLVLLAMLGGLYFLDWEAMIDVSRTGRYTLLLRANDFLDRTQRDYFAADALNNPFLHMWYLSVIVHMYIIFALACVLYRYLPRKIWKILIWLIGIASFGYGYSYYIRNGLATIGLPVWSQDTPVSHYLTLPRLWEPLAGACILLLPATGSKLRASVLSLLGLLATCIPALTNTGLTGACVPLVVLGTMLTIRYLPAGYGMAVLSNKLLMGLGAISFSLYLVHMPVIACYRAWCQDVSSLADCGIVISLSLLLSLVFWVCIEKRKLPFWITAILWALTFTLCLLGKELNGFKDYIHPSINSVSIKPYDNWELCKADALSESLDTKHLNYSRGVLLMAKSTKAAPKQKSPLFQLGTYSDNPSLVLLGDSHAQAAYFGLNELLTEMNVPGVILSSIVIPFWDRETPGDSAYYFNQGRAEALMTWLNAHPCITHVIIAQYWKLRLNSKEFIHWDKRREKMTPALYYRTLREFICKIRNLGKEVILLGPAPEVSAPNPPRYIRTELRKGTPPTSSPFISCTFDDFSKKNADVLSILYRLRDEGVCSLIDTVPFIQSHNPYCAFQDGTILMSDSNHLTPEGSTRMFQYLKPQIEKILPTQSKEGSTTPLCPIP